MYSKMSRIKKLKRRMYIRNNFYEFMDVNNLKIQHNYKSNIEPDIKIDKYSIDWRDIEF